MFDIMPDNRSLTTHQETIMPWWKKKKPTDVDALLEATRDWKPYVGANYDDLRTKAERHCAKAQRKAEPIRWWQPWRWFDVPCKLLGCRLHEANFIHIVPGIFFAVVGVFFGSIVHAEFKGTYLYLIPAFCTIISGAFLLEAVKNSWGARKMHAEELGRLRTRMGYMDTLSAYLLKEARKARTALIGEKPEVREKSAADLVAELAYGPSKFPEKEPFTGNSPLRVAQRKLANRLEEVAALLVRIAASLETERDERLAAVLRSGRDEAAMLDAYIAGMKRKVDERIAQIKAFFDECEARIKGLEAPILVMAMKAELALHRAAAQDEAQEAEQAITGALIELQTKWLAFQQTANTLLPPVVAKVFAETADLTDERQNLETLEAAMDRVFDALPALPVKPIAVS
jgi:hypothetical protein